ncbi:outer membrane beta-barrel protein [Magnetospirillum molischianum]|uniref:Outer membrane beta-barrel protein n=1 Tax=Magnetospirillum molischianum DSM 120 TaxID=1150626 RepID=H8FSP5_MAGML|nr:outer membrane beta-barrel protein [Magnetospirillum molischianum]CCG41383.1 conserved exported hypothetical protein [Magnetospirillum molischianum DSM 120]
MKNALLRLKLLSSVGFAAVMIAAGPAQAEQKPSESRTVRQSDTVDVTGASDVNRVSESYDAKGVDLGTFLFFPQIEVGETYNSNVFAVQNNSKGDWITSVHPQFRLQSRFPVHALELSGGLDRYDYATYHDDSRTDGHVSADGRINATKTTEIKLAGNLAHGHEDRSSSDAVAAASRPTPTDTINTLLSVKQVLNKLTLTGAVGVDRLTFENVDTNDGSIVRSNLRDRTEITFTQRGAYEFSPGYSGVLQVSENQREYDELDANRIDRSSSGYRVEGGLGLDISQLIKGDILVGYFNQDYSSSALRSSSGIGVKVALNWTPTQLTMVVPALERSVQETTTTSASGAVRTAGSVLVRHELQRNIILTGFASLTRNEYSGAGQSEWVSEARGTVTYAFTPEVFARGELAERIRRSSVDSMGYEQTTTMVRLGLRF